MGQLPENLFVILVTEEGNPGVLVAPDRVHNGECHQHPRGDGRVDLAKLAGFDATLDYSTQHLLRSGNDFIGVELRQVRELMELAEHQAVDGAEDGRPDELPVPAHGSAELLCRRTLSAGFLTFGNGGDRSLPDHLTEQLFLVWEVEVDGAFGDPGAFGDILEPGLGESAFAEDFECGLDDLLGPVFGSSTPLGRFSWRGCGARHRKQIAN